MRGPVWHPDFGVTGEPRVTSQPNYETYRDDEGNLKTRVLSKSEG